MENVGEGEVGIILEALLEASAEQYSLDLSKKVLRGQLPFYALLCLVV